MGENDTTKPLEWEARNGGSKESRPVDYAFWEVPGSPFKIIYSLSLFHEVDFVVNEGYRKIPHGGIEEGGLLFGTVEEDCIRVEAYRPIECEHASGPSFVLSESDMARLELQLTAATKDPDLAAYVPVGWFIAHTRSALVMSDLEMSQFERLFPQPSRLMVLIKPERFQPTRFGFLVRDVERNIPRDATNSAIILPLPGRTSKGSTLIPSLPAPTPTLTARKLAESFESPEEDLEPPPPPRRRSSARTHPQPAPDPLVQSIWRIPPEPEPAEPAEREVPEPEPLPVADERTDDQRAARKQLARDRARVIEESLEVPGRPPKAQPTQPPVQLPRSLPERPVSAEVYQQIEQLKAKSSEPILNSRSLTILAIAALLGCIVGYIGYLQLPAPVIPLEVHGHAQSVTVFWPADETKNAVFATIQVNNSEPVSLSPEEKASGQLELSAVGDVKVELMARNWMRDSRGVVHYLRSANGNANVLPSDQR